jgi:hypothetical protein
MTGKQRCFTFDPAIIEAIDAVLSYGQSRRLFVEQEILKALARRGQRPDISTVTCRHCRKRFRSAMPSRAIYCSTNCRNKAARRRVAA